MWPVVGFVVIALAATLWTYREVCVLRYRRRCAAVRCELAAVAVEPCRYHDPATTLRLVRPQRSAVLRTRPLSAPVLIVRVHKSWLGPDTRAKRQRA